MNRRKMIAATAALATSAVSARGQNKKATQAPAGKVKMMALSQPQIFAEAHVAGILLIAMHDKQFGYLLNQASPTGDLYNKVDTAVYAKVHNYTVQNKAAVSAAVAGFRAMVATLANLATPVGTTAYDYTGNPDACLDCSNVKIVQALFNVKPS